MRAKVVVSAISLLVAAPLGAQTSSLSAIQTAQVYSASPFSNDRFGRDVLLDGAVALVMYGTFTSSYLVRCIADVGGTWTYPASPGFATQGYTMSFAGNLYLQGFPYASPLDRVAVWRRNGSTWSQSWLSIPDVGPADETFGVSTDIDGATVVIGNHYHTQSLTEEGAVYVYEDTGSSLVLRQRIFGGVAGARLGVSVRVSGEDLLVYCNAAPNTFGVRAYRRQNGVWVLAQSDAAPVGQLSGGIELDRGLAVARTSGGGFYVLAHAGNEWFVDATIPPIPGSASAYDFELDGGVIAASDPEADLAASDGGAVRLYARNDGWKLQATVVASDAQQLDYFGYGIGLQGNRLMVGAPNDDDLANDAGAVYEFRLDHAHARVHCVPEKSSLGCIAHIGFAGVPSASSGAPFTLSASNAISRRGGMLVYGTSGPAFVHYPGGVRCVAAPRRTTARQSSGGTSGASDCSGAFTLDFNALVASGVDPLLFVGQSVDAQWVYRDPLGPSALASSEAVHFTIAP
jgi:hypothetical protein